MKRSEYEVIEKYMMECMNDSAHDRLHVYRVLYLALEIAKKEKDVNLDILITACLLHDIGREQQFLDPTVCHAQAGAEVAYGFLINQGWSDENAQHVKDCISTHRFRGDNIPKTIEAKILYDSDKLDITGAIGIARCLIYAGITSEPLYKLDENGKVMEAPSGEESSFFQEYNFKLKKIYAGFYTERGKIIAAEREAISKQFYESMLNEVALSHNGGESILEEALE